MTNLIGEIEKVGAYAKGPRITRQDIEAVATPQLDAVVFRMTDAIGEGNFDRAAQVLGELYQMQEPPGEDHVVPWAGRCGSCTPPGWPRTPPCAPP